MTTEFIQPGCCCLGAANDENIRYRATSGGVGSALIARLFATGEIGTVLTFEFDPATLRYLPRLVHRAEDYRICGSIYQEINLSAFLYEHRAEIRGRLALFALPCQVGAIRNLLAGERLELFIIALTCSAQQSLEATRYLLRRLAIPEPEVAELRYRGDGWPGGVAITRKDGSIRRLPNLGSDWTKIFHSRLFTQPRCFRCEVTISETADLALADPWLPEFMGSETRGLSLVQVNTAEGARILREAVAAGTVRCDPFDPAELRRSQTSTLRRKASYARHPVYARTLRRICLNRAYRRLVLSSNWLFRGHCQTLWMIEKLMERL